MIHLCSEIVESVCECIESVVACQHVVTFPFLRYESQYLLLSVSLI